MHCMIKTTDTNKLNALHESCHDVIAEARRKAAEAQARDRTAAAAEIVPPRPANPVAKDEPERKAIIPYLIVDCIAALDNIYETRLFGWVLAKAQAVLKLYNKDLSEINLQHALGLTRLTLPARLLLNPGDKNYGNIEKSFTLATKKIRYERNERIYHLNIIAFPEIKKDGRNSMITFVIHTEIWHALLDFSKGYRTFSLSAYIRLTTKYSVIMYLLCSQQTTPKSYSCMKLKQLLGCADKRSYDRGANFVTKVLDPAREELMAKAPYYFDYSCTKSGRSHQISDIIIIPQVNPAPAPFDDKATRAQTEALRLRIDDDVRKYCTDNFTIKVRPLERLEPLLLRIGDKQAQLLKLAEIKEQTSLRRVKNKAGYLTKSLQNLYR